jgi:hypothetical protein
LLSRFDTPVDILALPGKGIMSKLDYRYVELAFAGKLESLKVINAEKPCNLSDKGL